MKKLIYITILFLGFLSTQFVFSQEWKNISEYSITTGFEVLQDDCWLEKGRNKNTETWKKANKYNLSIENGNLKYNNIS